MKKPDIKPDGIIIPSSTDFLAEVDCFIEAKLAEAGVDQSIMTDIAIAVSELVNNAIRHGNQSDPDKQVDIRFNISSSKLVISVIDQGGGFKKEEIANPIDDDNLLREVGRGIFIVENFVDDVEITELDSGGTRVKITKNL